MQPTSLPPFLACPQCGGQGHPTDYAIKLAQGGQRGNFAYSCPLGHNFTYWSNTGQVTR